MRVIISEDVLDVARDSPWDLTDLLGFACRGQHVVSFDPPAALERCLDIFDVSTRRVYAGAIANSARAATTLPADVATVRVEATASPRWEDPVAILPLNAALLVLKEPLGVLVENAATDWKFLLGIMRRSERERVLRAVAAQWVTPLHGGGSTLHKELLARLDLHHKGLRTFVVFDSDRLHPDELAPTWTPQRPGHRAAACAPYKWEQLTRAKLPRRYWMLQRRFIESYMPKTELVAGASEATHPDATEAFYRMSQEERWYFNMKEGFDGDEGRHDKDRRRTLYATIDPADREALRGGFGSELANQYVHATSRDFDWDDETRREAAAVIPRLMRLL